VFTLLSTIGSQPHQQFKAVALTRSLLAILDNAQVTAHVII
jgi:hypothetical protein